MFFRAIRVLIIVCTFLRVAGPARADDLPALDFGAWKRMPVFDRGRLMPLDTFARSAVQKICGRTRPKLDPAAALEALRGDSDSPGLIAIRQLFPEGRPRKYDAAELLFSWLVEPEKWEHVPFLIARHKELREDLLDLPIVDENGHRLKHVSPRLVETAYGFHSRAAELQRQQRAAEEQGREFSPSVVDEKVEDLVQAYNRYRFLTFDPAAPMISRHRFFNKLAAAVQAWSSLEAGLRRLGRPGNGQALSLPIDEVSDHVRRLVMLVHREEEEFALQDVEPLLLALRRSTAELAGQVEAECRRAFTDSAAGDRQRSKLNELAADSAQLAQLSDELHMALYDTGQAQHDTGLALRLVPALNAAALRADRDLDDDNQPWLSIQAVLYGSGALLGDYPQHELKQVREAFRRVKRVYVDRAAADRPKRFAEAMEEFAAAVRTLGEKIEPLRRELPIKGTEEDKAAMLAATAYPPEGYTETELLYNRVDPFLWSWVVCLLSTLCFALTFGVLRKPLFWSGILVVLAAQVLIVFGLTLRAMITGWVPVTNMFETIVFVGLVVAMLGTWFTLLPLIWPGITKAWRMAALPVTSTLETIVLAALVVAMVGVQFPLLALLARLRDSYDSWIAALGSVVVVLLPPIGCAGLYGGLCWVFRQFRAGRNEADTKSLADRATGPREPDEVSLCNWILLLPQLYLMGWTFSALALASYGSGGENPIIRLWPKTDVGSWVPSSINAVLAWVVGLCVLVPTVWYGARVVLASALSLGTISYRWVKQGFAEPLKDVYRRKLFVMVGAAAGFLFCLIAYNWPAREQGMGGMQAVIRDNFWLTVHVLSITASYGAAALAWGMANISLAYYLFGRYREPDHPAQSPAGTRHRGLRCRPPEACATLAGFTYRAIQVAFLLLAVGTILGALWADVAWGRFWGWDAKEVWSLISLLAYAIILHSRYAGWSGNFGFAVGAVLGATSIAMAWYGVNYILGSGLHTYGGGSGGKWYVVVATLCNWVFVVIAAVRYNIETSRRYVASADTAHV